VTLPSASDETFDELMRDLDPPLLVVTTAHDDERAGCLVGFHSQCGIAPRRYALWISRANRTAAVATRATAFAVHVLGAQQHELAALFGAKTGDDIDKFARCAWVPGRDGVPLLADCPDRITGRKRDLVEVDADHVCLVIEPLDTHQVRTDSWLRLAEVHDLRAGHPPDDPPHPR
jgi:flavin reductase (DIM6/NTAB) family NADH-FMN oxidoreductase RutF